MTHTVVGLFDDKTHARAAMDELIEHGFIQDDIDLSNRAAAGGDTADNAGIGDRITNFFNSLFGDDEETARTYTNAASDADAILTVQVDSSERAREAQAIFDRHDAIDAEDGTRSFGQQTAGGRDSQATIPVIEEKMNVNKREVERGGARIRSRIVEKPVEASVRLREEHVVVNRRPVDREVTDADRANFRPGEMEITEHAEVPVIGKEARVVEEVEVGRTVAERDETVRDTVRSTDVDVEKIDSETDARSRTARP